MSLSVVWRQLISGTLAETENMAVSARNAQRRKSADIEIIHHRWDLHAHIVSNAVRRDPSDHMHGDQHLH